MSTGFPANVDGNVGNVDEGRRKKIREKKCGHRKSVLTASGR